MDVGRGVFCCSCIRTCPEEAVSIGAPDLLERQQSTMKTVHSGRSRNSVSDPGGRSGVRRSGEPLPDSSLADGNSPGACAPYLPHSKTRLPAGLLYEVASADGRPLFSIPPEH